MGLVRIQSPAPAYNRPLTEAKTITVTGRDYRYTEGHTLDATAEDAVWITQNVPGWTMVGPVEEPTIQEQP